MTDKFDKLTLSIGGPAIIIYLPIGSGDAIISAMEQGDRLWRVKGHNNGEEIVLNLRAVQAISITRSVTIDNSTS